MKEGLEKQSNFISLIIHLKDNETSIVSFLLTLDSYIKENFIAYEYIIVNNFSKDNSVNNIKQIRDELSGKITIINLAHTHTKEAAMVAGNKLAIGDYVFEFEAPIMDYSLADIDSVYKKALSGFDIVTATPNKKEAFSKKVFYFILRKFGGTKNKLQTETFKILSRRAINRIYKDNFTFLYRKIVYQASGFDIFVYSYKKVQSNFKEKSAVKEDLALGLNIILRYTKVYLLLPVMSLILFAISLLFSLITSNIFIEIATFLLVLVIFLSTILKLIQAMYEEFCRTPLYVVKSVERL